MAYQKIDQAQQAQADLDQAALTPQDSEDWRGRGIALYELQRYEEAIASYNQCDRIAFVECVAPLRQHTLVF
ncbi:MAG: hypothetical protein ICV85_09545 [Tolypothrix sp. T3-bin4]|nr:hypothetical protein [Tolypothrix sp. T3-bin4]